MRITWIELRGFRPFGVEPQRIELHSGLTVVHAPNSQGKSSLAEGFEFLLTGGSSRRELLGGAKNEYDQCLRNVHLARTEPVWVRAGLELDDGTVVEFRRDLDADYTSTQECRSTLRIGGVIRQSVTEAGFPLSSGSLRSPILFAHTLRWVLSAAPSERATYFKALLDIADLDLVRKELAKLLDEFDRKPENPLVEKLRECSKILAVDKVARRLRVARSSDSTKSALRDAICSVLSGTDVQVPKDGSLDEAANALHVELDRRRSQVFPLSQLRPRRLPDLQRPLEGKPDALGKYQIAAAGIDAETAKLIPVFSAVLAIPEISQMKQSLPCPVCATQEALTPDRINELRRRLADNSSFQDASRDLTRWIDHLLMTAKATSDMSSTLVVDAQGWTQDERQSYRTKVVALGIDSSEFDEVISKADEIGTCTRALTEVASKLASAATEVRKNIDCAEPIAGDLLARVEMSSAALTKEHARLKNARDDCDRSFDALSTSVSRVLDKKVDTSGWAPLLDLANHPSDLMLALKAAHSREAARQRLTQAIADVESAVMGVLDNRFVAMSGQIRRWWETLRPGELVCFEEVARRSTGKRYIDVKARLSAGVGQSGVLRDAISVLSDSQLNALGLATFLARCHIEGTPMIVLDDPVPASDPEHRYTFADQTVTALLNDGSQLLVTTHDPDLAELLQVSHAHRGIEEYTVSLENPGLGAVLLRNRDEFEHLLRKAEQQMDSPLSDNRKAAGQSLREAAERLAKQVIIAYRKTEDPRAKCSDLDGKCLRDLIPLVSQHAVECDEPGKWRALKDILNPASHAAPPPESIALRNAHGNLRKFKKDHERSLPGLHIT
jgi:DNA repair exonuclease SbcCD ATPase subunit